MSSINRAITQVEITILDINDHIPSFDEPLYVVNVSELAAINSTVVQLTAFDRDQVKIYPCHVIANNNISTFREPVESLYSPFLMLLMMNYHSLFLLTQYKILAWQTSY